MKALILAALALSACADAQLAKLQADHRAYVCTHTVAVSLAANAVIDNAGSIKDENARAAAVTVARSDLAIVAGCATP